MTLLKPVDADPETPVEIDMFTMVVLRRRFEAIIRDMVNALFKSGRSGVLNTAMDFTCSLTDDSFQTISTALGLPMHAGAIDLIPQAVAKKFGSDINPGDCFVNNSGYMGNTHCADFTLCTPVFFEGELMFYTIARAHMGDMGFPTPTTYGPRSRDVYEEGLMLPCIRIQKDRKDIPEVVDICKANIRVPDQFYGDYLACLSAVRTGEAAIAALIGKYGKPVIREFIKRYQQYAEDMAIDAIRKLPKGTLTRTAFHDTEMGIMPDGIPVRATITVDPDEAMIEVDLRDNIDNIPLGINMTESTTTACARNAVLNVLGPDVPRCTGAYSRIRLLMREGSAIGIPKFPYATSSATTNFAQILVPLIQSMFAEMKPGLGTAFGNVGNPASCSALSGTDSRHDDRACANQMILGYWGGPALPGYDGWLTYGGSGSMGVIWQSSIEIVEQQHPILVEYLEINPDSGGAGQWEGGPGASFACTAREDLVRFTANSAGRQFPPKGVAGGLNGAPAYAWKQSLDGGRELLDSSVDAQLEPGTTLISHGCGGGGYGDPLERDPARVAVSYTAGWISAERVSDVYGVVLTTDGEIYTVDETATAARRAELRAAAQAETV